MTHLKRHCVFRIPRQRAVSRGVRRLLVALFLLVIGCGARGAVKGEVDNAVPDYGAGAVTTTVAGHPAGDAMGTVEIRRSGGRYHLYRDGRPFYIKGVGGRGFLDAAVAAGANSLRTWGALRADEILDRAAKLGMTVTLGIWLSHRPSDYLSQAYRQKTRDEVLALVRRHRHHPSLLIWSLGNEINLQGKDTEAAWRYVNELATMIKTHDPHHPVITVIAYKPRTVDHIARFAPALDAIGINAYGALPGVRETIEASLFQGPYLITEWGVQGHWEADRTGWGRPIEPTSAQKAEQYRRYYVEHILANQDRCLGSYVFLWGQKQERTPTWYSMFLESIPGVEAEGLASPAVDVMALNWSGAWPQNRSPAVFEMILNGRTAHEDITLNAGAEMAARVAAEDPEADELRYVWEILKEPAMLSIGGAPEPKPKPVGPLSKVRVPHLHRRAPNAAGAYRLFVYVLDPNGHVGTANVPFQVKADSTVAPAGSYAPASP